MGAGVSVRFTNDCRTSKSGDTGKLSITSIVSLVAEILVPHTNAAAGQ